MISRTLRGLFLLGTIAVTSACVKGRRNTVNSSSTVSGFSVFLPSTVQLSPPT